MPVSAHHLHAVTRRFSRACGQRRTALLGVQVLYLLLLCGWLLVSHTWPAPDVVVIGFLFLAILSARGLHFLRDWTPFLTLLLAYVALPGVVPGLEERAHVALPIRIDRWLGGGELPTLRLQGALWDPNHLHWYDYATAVLYLLHFIVPLLVAYVFWHWRHERYARFVYSFLLLCYAGFATYLLYPMAPPWWASQRGHIPEVHSVLSAVHWQGLSNPVVLTSRYFKTDPVAAMPSLHVALPVLVWLVLWRVWPKWGWAVVVYPLAMTFAVMYAGEHYLVDCLAGAAYAAIAFGVAWWLPERRRRGAGGPGARAVAGRRRFGFLGSFASSGLNVRRLGAAFCRGKPAPESHPTGQTNTRDHATVSAERRLSYAHPPTDRQLRGRDGARSREVRTPHAERRTLRRRRR